MGPLVASVSPDRACLDAQGFAAPSASSAHLRPDWEGRGHPGAGCRGGGLCRATWQSQTWTLPGTPRAACRDNGRRQRRSWSASFPGLLLGSRLRGQGLCLPTPDSQGNSPGRQGTRPAAPGSPVGQPARPGLPYRCEAPCAVPSPWPAAGSREVTGGVSWGRWTPAPGAGRPGGNPGLGLGLWSGETMLSCGTGGPWHGPGLLPRAPLDAGCRHPASVPGWQHRAGSRVVGRPSPAHPDPGLLRRC